MSAASRKNDPFHFDEIYKQAGVEDLFVKKTLGELKQKQTAPGPVPASPPARPAPQAPAPKPVANASNFDLDFLSTIAKPAGATPNAPKHSSTPNLLASAGVQQPPKPQPQQPAVASSRQQPADDPFALFQEVPGAAPAQRHTPPPAPRPQPTGGTGFLLDFDDGNAFPAAPVPPAVPAPKSSPALAPVSGSGPPPAAAPPRPVVEQPAAAPARPAAPAAAAPPAPPPRPPQPAPPPAPAATPASAPPPPPPPPPDYAFHEEHHPAPAPPSYSSADIRAGSFGATAWAPGPPRDFGSADSYVSAPDSYPGVGYVPAASEPSNSSSSSFTWNHTPSSSGLSGMLKAFGKKAVRAAKAGLAQLEHALEGLEQPAGQQQQQGGGQLYSQYQPPQTSGRSSGGRSQDEDADVDRDHALAWAVRLADMPPHAQQQELSQMAPPLRRKVIEILREQIRMEHEASSQVMGHGHALGAGTGPEPPSYGLGHGGPMSYTGPAPYPEAAPQERPPGHPPAAGRVGERERPAPNGVVGPGAAGVTARAAAAAAGAAQEAQPSQPEPQQDAHAGHDLLGIGSGGGVPPAPVSVTGAGVAAAPAPVPAMPAAVVDDLLGIGDEGPSRHRPPQQPAAATKPAAPAASAPPPPAAAAAPPPTPAVVHVDDIDDFFSGGRASGQSAAAAARGPGAAAAATGAAMHVSSSAPNLGGGRGAVSSSNSAAALADMLLHDDDVIGGVDGGANVDVSGYEDLYRGEQGSADEPELRKRLRAQREAAKHAKMKAALAEKKALEAEEAARREAQVVLKDQYKADIEAWKNRHKGNIRGLLVTLQTVLWPDSGWVPVSVGDLLEPVQIKKVYMRANLLVHPDKVRQRNGTAEQVAIADMVFDVLKDAWNAFR